MYILYDRFHHTTYVDLNVKTILQNGDQKQVRLKTCICVRFENDRNFLDLTLSLWIKPWYISVIQKKKQQSVE